MSHREAIALTPRQREVIDLLDQRVVLKDIAGRLTISESRVNQHVRELKRLYGVNSLSELVAARREELRENPDATPCRFSAERKNELPPAFAFSQQAGQADEGELVLADAQSFSLGLPWADTNEPVVVPQVLDGNNAVLLRMAAVAIILVAVLGSIVLAISAYGALPKLAHLVRQLS